MSDFIDLLLRTGRPGGAVSVAVGLICFAIGAFSGAETGVLSTILPALGLVFVLFGGLLLVHGDPEGGEFKAKEGEPPSPELLAALGTTPRPFFLCTRCRTIGEVGLCPRCKKGLDCVEVRDDEDLRLALIGLT